MDNTHIRSSFYTVYSQFDILDVSTSRKRSLRETAKIQANWEQLETTAALPLPLQLFKANVNL